jgi:hypothetical protein
MYILSGQFGITVATPELFHAVVWRKINRTQVIIDHLKTEHVDLYHYGNECVNIKLTVHWINIRKANISLCVKLVYSELALCPSYIDEIIMTYVY